MTWQFHQEKPDKKRPCAQFRKFWYILKMYFSKSTLIFMPQPIVLCRIDLGKQFGQRENINKSNGAGNSILNRIGRVIFFKTLKWSLWNKRKKTW